MRVKQNTSKKFNLLQIRFFVTFICFNFPIFLVGPFCGLLYTSHGVPREQAAQIRIVFTISNAIFSIFTGAFISKIGHQKSLALASIVSSLGNLFRYLGGITNYYLASVFTGIGAALNKVVFNDFFLLEEPSTNQPNSNVIFSENKSFFSFLISILVSPAGDYINENHGTESLFLIACVIFVFVLIPIYICFYTTAQQTKKDSNTSFTKVLFSIVKPKDIRLPLTVFMVTVYEVLPIILHGSFVAFFAGKKLPNGAISGIFNISKLIGIFVLPIISKFIPTKYIVSLYCALLVLIDYLMAIWFNDKVTLLVLVIVSGAIDGGITSLLLNYQKQYYEPEIRAAIMGTTQLTTSVLASFFLMIMRKYNSQQQLVKFDMWITVALLIASLLFNFVGKEEKAKEKVKKE
ncbi:major facilitator superfamily transporter [Histomonas meleagridis]|uniref:major facilitator superfamily transporter n=1 Tax=Histomonas meleagridis TaxID=135588 RepID=UPI0035597C31|nr:major facilitator superfamily transporter [Histomonas meleagridis]KAH0806023.1 major facilitator superfamily transporter [Histomonas meleagridis]